MEGKSIPGKLIVAANQKQTERKFWLEHLAGEPVKGQIPYDFDQDKQRQKERRSGEFSFYVSGEPYKGLKKLSAGSDVRLHIILAALLFALLEKYSPNNRSDFIIGTPIYSQRKPGEYINTVLPMRAAIEADMSFKDLLLNTRTAMVDASENQAYPIEVLARDLGLDPFAQDFPLFDIAFLLENIQDKKDIHHLAFNLLCNFNHVQEKNCIEASLQYNVYLFKETGMRRLAAHFGRLLEHAVSRVDAALKEIEILSPEEKDRLLNTFNDTDAPAPPVQVIHRWFERQVEKTPDHIAVTMPALEGNSSNRTNRTYKELNEEANRLAHELRSRGIGPDNIVAVIMEPSAGRIAAILAVLKAGGAYLPIDPAYPMERIMAILDSGDTALILTHSAMMDRFSYTSLLGLARIAVEPARTGARERCDFDKLPMPDRGLVDYSRYNRFIGHAMVKNSISMLGSRGCPFKCAYCHRIWPRKHIFRSAENLFEEVKFYYDMGIRRFDLIDDIFNFNKENSTRFFRYIIQNKLDIQLFFPNGLRGDILTKEYIDMMVEAGTINIDLALEAASPRLQKLIGKHLKLETFRENIQYIATKYPQVILDLNVMYGFPSETEAEAMMSYDFIKSIKWLDFPYVFILKIHPGTDMGQLALDHGISPAAIARSMNFSYHDVPATLPFSRQFAEEFKTRFLSEYFLSRERLLHVLPYQMQAVNRDELVKKYDNYLPMKISSFDDILKAGNISHEELGGARFNEKDYSFPPDFNERVKARFQPRIDAVNAEVRGQPFKILLLDLSELFSGKEQHILHGEIVVPHGIMSLMTHLNETFGRAISGKVAKSKVDFDSYDELEALVTGFKPHVIGIRSLSFYKDFFHKAVARIREWGIDVPIIAGGPYATMDYKLLLQDPLIDLAVLGEGEGTLVELIRHMMKNPGQSLSGKVLETIKGIAYIQDKDKTRLKQSHRGILPLDKIDLNIHPVQNLEESTVSSQPDNLLYLISTSGSTGKPKSVMLEHRNLANLMRFQFTKSQVEFNRVLQFASIGFDVSAQEIFSTLLSGGRLFLMDNEMKSDLPRLFQYISENRIEVLYLPPAFVRFIFSDPRYFADFPTCVKHIITAGEQLIVVEAFRQYLQENQVTLHNHYGPSETHVVTTLTLKPGNGIPERPSIGYPIANTQIYILDASLHPKPIGAVGELYIGGANVGRGYANSEELTNEKFCGGPDVLGGFSKEPPGRRRRMYRTGDLARWLEDGAIEFLGRVDVQVKIRGFRIEPGEIERVLAEITSVSEALVIGRSDASGDLYLCAYVVSPVKLDKNYIKDILSHSLPDYMVPAFIVQLDKLPLTANGKLDRRALPEPEPETAGKNAYVAPRDDIETTLAGIWADILGIGKDVSTAPIGIDVDFFKLGGHSLKATILISRIHKEFDVKLSLVEMFENPTIRELAARIKQSVESRFAPIEPVPESRYYPLSSAQRRLYVIYRMDPENLIYNMPETLLLQGKVDTVKLEKTFRQLIQRHESLRTSFHMVEGEPVQRVHEGVDFKIGPIGPIGPITPFDLSRPPLLSVSLGEAPDGLLLSIDMHHIITDGLSMEVFLKDFLAIYNGRELMPLRIQYKDFAIWQNREKEKGIIKKQEEYWLDRFRQPVPVLDLPMDFPRPLVRRAEGALFSFQLPEQRGRALQPFARDNGLTMFSLMLACLNIFLLRLSSYEDRDIVVGAPSAGRRHADLDGVMGMFVNMLPMLNRPLRDMTVNRFLGEIKNRSLEAFENQDYPFEDLVDHVAGRRDTSRNPLFDAVLLVQDFDLELSPGQMDFTFKRRGHQHQNKDVIAKFDLSLHVEPGENPRFMFEYAASLFKQETIQRFAAYFKRIVETILSDPLVKIGDIDVISQEETRQLVHDFNATDVDMPADVTLHRMFEQQVARTPEAIALIAAENRSDRTDRTHMSYQQLDQRADELATELSQKGVRLENGIESVVAISMEPCLEMAVAILAVLKAGAAYLPIDPTYPQDRIDFMLKDSAATFLIDTASKVPSPITPRSGGVCGNGQRREQFSSPAYIIYTSGTTGQPKGVPVSHSAIVNTITYRAEEYKMSQGDVALQLFSFSFDGFVTSFFTPIVSGAAALIPSKQELMDLSLLKSLVVEHRVTHFICVPSLYRELVQALSAEDMESLKIVTLAGEALPPDLIQTSLEKAPHLELSHEYGVTEAAVMSTILRHQEKTKEISIGKPIRNTKIHILDSRGRLQPIGVPGELYIAGAGLANGYLNNTDLTTRKFIKSFAGSRGGFSKEPLVYRTGDLARWLPGGTLRFLGRIDSQVKVRGFRIETAEIEQHLIAHGNIKEAAVVDWRDNLGDSHLCAYFTAEEAPSSSELKQHLVRFLPDYMIPAYFIPLQRLPLTPNGKLDRRALPEPGTGEASESDYVAPAGGREEQIVAAWKQVLGLEQIGTHDNFFDVGGNSVKILRLSLVLKESMGLDLPVAQLFQYPTISAQAGLTGGKGEKEHFSNEFQSDKVKNRLKQRRKRS